MLGIQIQFWRNSNEWQQSEANLLFQSNCCPITWAILFINNNAIYAWIGHPLNNRLSAVVVSRREYLYCLWFLPLRSCSELHSAKRQHLFIIVHNVLSFAILAWQQIKRREKKSVVAAVSVYIVVYSNSFFQKKISTSP